MHIPHDQLAPDTLRSLIEEFVTREGTEYGAQDISLATKVTQVMGQLERGEIAISYDMDTGTCNIVPRA